jgi:hypothetical protein
MESELSKKVVHISLNSVYTDGWTYQDEMLSKFHKRLGYDVTVLTSHFIYDDKGNIVWDDRDTYINDDGVKVCRLSMKGKNDFSRKLMHFENFYQVLVDEKADIFFVHGVNFTDISLLVKYIKENPSVSVYVDNHGDFSNSGTNWISKNILHGMIWKHYSKKLEPYVKKFYGVTPSRVDFFKEMYGTPADKTELLVMGVDDDEVTKALSEENRKAIRRKFNIADDDFLIITGGKIDIPKKQTINLMKAVNNSDNEKVKLIVFGSVIDELKDKVNAEISDKCQYIGWIDSKETLNYYGAADLVVFPGRHSVFWEQVTGIGKPMICKYWEGTTHVDLGGNVKFLYKDTVEELTKVLNTVINSPEEYNHMKTVAEEKGMKVFSYSQIAKYSIEG